MSRLINKIKDAKFNLKMRRQRLTRGYDDLGWWNFYGECAKFCIPRLKHLRDNFCGVPCNGEKGMESEEWKEIINTMVVAFEKIEAGNDFEESDRKAIELGLANFSKWFQNLWD